MAKVIDSATLEWKELAESIQARIVTGEHCTAQIVLLKKGANMNIHSHPQEQITYLLEGELEVDVEGELHRLQAGEFVIIPENVAHSAKVGLKPARGLDIFSPVREDLKY